MRLFLLIVFIADKHLFIWLDQDVVAHDALIQGKESWLNKPWFFIRGFIFLGGWSLYRYFARKFSVAQDNAEINDNRNFKKSFRIAAGFLVFFIYTESIMSWDWIMSVDPHWFSTLFGWYVFASMFVSGITVIALITIYLKSRNFLEFVNENHLHDVAKFMFAFSIFWTYLWFSQFMLIWYSNIPEEVTYFVTRFQDYKLPFLGMVVMNFVFPLLLLIRCLSSITSLADLTKENPIQSTSCCNAITKSALSFLVRLEILILVSGKLSPFFENNNPPAMTLVFTVSFKLVSMTSR